MFRMMIALLLMSVSVSAYSSTMLSVRPGIQAAQDGIGRQIEADLTFAPAGLLPFLPADFYAGLTGGLLDSPVQDYSRLMVAQLKGGVLLGYSLNFFRFPLRLSPELAASYGYLEMGNALRVSNLHALVVQAQLKADYEVANGLRLGAFGGYSCSFNELYPWQGITAGLLVTLELKKTIPCAEKELMAEQLKKDMVDTGESVVSSTTEELKVRLGEILFELNKSELKPELRERILKMAALAVKYPNLLVIIEGYTDDTGSETRNLELSSQRAESVAAVFSEAGIPALRLSAQGMGSASPLVPNTSSENRSKNRRVEIRFKWN